MPVARLVWNRLSALVGAVLFAGAGAAMGSMNAGWFGLERNANALFPLLGVGSGLVVIGFVRSDLKRELYRTGGFGRAARYLLVAGPVLMMVSGLVEFAIFGTLALGFGLASLTVVVVRRRLLDRRQTITRHRPHEHPDLLTRPHDHGGIPLLGLWSVAELHGVSIEEYLSYRVPQRLTERDPDRPYLTALAGRASRSGRGEDR